MATCTCQMDRDNLRMIQDRVPGIVIRGTERAPCDCGAGHFHQKFLVVILGMPLFEEPLCRSQALPYLAGLLQGFIHGVTFAQKYASAMKGTRA